MKNEFLKNQKILTGNYFASFFKHSILSYLTTNMVAYYLSIYALVTFIVKRILKK